MYGRKGEISPFSKSEEYINYTGIWVACWDAKDNGIDMTIGFYTFKLGLRRISTDPLTRGEADLKYGS
jgi:hypothetical protein